ncbi:hypothetical protein BIV57_08990 [Mangrovactinospora gilvigrisea]|uniref:Uncharacterized protein n=1 Tax=Mangrovactinospora gilvigrisea TaxID=1428644 RepID=A0A1J7BGX5_9ACTN|nr:hypothetical protein [Mangrovactinospora gilvigrisea]OIV37821.1 hypothetical protein BIV57_08990 [Mangrovactinospora gilvigrisea]
MKRNAAAARSAEDRAGTATSRRTALRAGAVAAGTTIAMALSSPAFALIHDDGEDPGPGLGVGATLGLFVGLPLVIFLFIAGLVMLFSKKPGKN